MIKVSDNMFINPDEIQVVHLMGNDVNIWIKGHEVAFLIEDAQSFIEKMKYRSDDERTVLEKIVDSISTLHKQEGEKSLIYLFNSFISRAKGMGVDVGQVSDGFHTFNQIYDTRMAYNAAFFNLLEKIQPGSVVKSFRHHGDEEPIFGGGWFAVRALLDGKQVTQHYKEECWYNFNCPEVENLPEEWDGHTNADAIIRLLEFDPEI